jgi:N-acetylmuramoyl-L-alanine amidase
MEWQKQREPDSRPVVDWLAGQIHDPVAKLRFLKVATAYRLQVSRKATARRRYVFLAIFCALAFLFLVRAKARVETSAPHTTVVAAPPPVARRAAGGPPAIWQVEKTAEFEIYSNGLRIETRYEVSTHPRRYVAFSAGGSRRETGKIRNTPAGIVFHATESRQAPFEERENRVLKKLGESMLDYVRRKCAYNFVIDRFGRVYRVVREGDAANHAGFSLWSDERWTYLNLNESFLGVSFEAGAVPGKEAAISPAQERAAAVLVEMLRSRYSIPAADCVTHAQVSVNPDNMRVGYHTDWASGFPFEAVGLPNNYDLPLWAVADSGFECDPAFLERAGIRLRRGIETAEGFMHQEAAGKGVTPAAYRLQLRRRYRERLALVRRTAAGAPVPDQQLTSAIK